MCRYLVRCDSAGASLEMRNGKIIQEGQFNNPFAKHMETLLQNPRNFRLWLIARGEKPPEFLVRSQFSE